MANIPMTWAAPTVGYASYLTTELDTLADGKIIVGAAINNETNLCTYLDLELMLASLDLSGQSAPSVDIYLLESIDGGGDFDTATNDTTTEALMPPVSKIITKMGLRPGSAGEAKIAIATMIPIAPGQWKLAPRNKTGVTFGASGNILSYRTYNLKAVTA